MPLITPTNSLLRLSSIALPLLGILTTSFGQVVDAKLYSGLVWRNLGPFRGGRVSAVSGAIGQPGVFYMGLPAGGVWKTTSAGETWYPVFDSITEASSVGAVAVAPSDPNVIYVGMGDMPTGGAINEGNGVYKSTDAGRTWRHLGLDNTKQIPSIVIDPQNPDIVMVAAQGDLHTKSTDRGLYRSTDGGKSWTKTLYVDDQTGVQKITFAQDRPAVMLATTDRHYSAPGAGRGGPGGGGGGQGPTGTALYKSIDEGVTWKKVLSDGLPDLAGRTCVAVAMNTNAERMFLVGNFGLYRSDDGGVNWRRMDATDRRVMNGQGGYNCGVYVNPGNPDSVYVINTSSYHSTDGGNTFTGFKGAPGGDDPQQMWIDPTDGKRMLLGTDQGSTVSLDGGENWSSWYNQSTAQVYHISTDNQFPYWVYATQQDSGSIATSSRGNFGEITPLDWLPHPGYEFGSIVADPRNPRISYSGGEGGGIVRVTYPSGQWINVSPNVDSKEALRHVLNQPISFAPTNPRELLVGFQCLMATDDGGMHWKKLSPDLGFPEGYVPPKPVAAPTPAKAKAPPIGTVADPDQEGNVQAEEDDPDELAEQQLPPGAGGSIESFSASSLNGNVIWVGTNNGLLKLTRDHGATWEDVSIPHLPNPTRADISAVDASHQEAGTAYVAVDCHNAGDYRPYFYKTHDFGQSWTKIVGGLPTDQASGSFSRVIRSDTKKQGLLFAGTESSTYVSFNDGDSWQSLALNLPTTSCRDMTIHDNDLVVGTYGRGFWVLDDISPLRQMTAEVKAAPATLFKPGEATRVRRNVNGDTPFPPEVPHALNPPLGAIIYYYLGRTPTGVISLDITDAAGKQVRHMSSEPLSPSKEPPPPVPDFWVEKRLPMPAQEGMSRINWNLRYDSPPAFSHDYPISANPGLTPATPEGPLVLPGTYKATLTVDGKQYSQLIVVRNDPRSPASASDLRAQHTLQMRLYEAARDSWNSYQDVSKMRAEVAAAKDANSSPELSAAASILDAKLAAIGGSGGGGRRGGFFRPGGPPPAPTFAALSGALTRQLNGIDSGDMAPNEPSTRAATASFNDLKDLDGKWKALRQKELPAFNLLLARLNLKQIS